MKHAFIFLCCFYFLSCSRSVSTVVFRYEYTSSKIAERQIAIAPIFGEFQFNETKAWRPLDGHIVDWGSFIRDNSPSYEDPVSYLRDFQKQLPQDLSQFSHNTFFTLDSLDVSSFLTTKVTYYDPRLGYDTLKVNLPKRKQTIGGLNADFVIFISDVSIVYGNLITNASPPKFGKVKTPAGSFTPVSGNPYYVETYEANMSASCFIWDNTSGILAGHGTIYVVQKIKQNSLTTNDFAKMINSFANQLISGTPFQN